MAMARLGSRNAGADATHSGDPRTADEDPDRDEEWFKEVYGKEYTGPMSRTRQEDSIERSNPAKRPAAESDEDEGPRDPNAVPTDFTSREAKVWEAKAKAIERNWKRRKEEELNCKICGESGHFAQGCPTTLGGTRKSGEVVERIPLRDKRLKPRLIGSGGSVIQGIEKDTGCRLKLEDNHTAGHGSFFVRVSGPDRLTVSKAVSSVKKLVDQVEDEWRNQTTRRPQRSTNVNPLIAAQMEHIQRLQHSSNGGASRRDDDRFASQLETRRQWEAGTQALNGSGRSGKSRDDFFRGRSQDNGSYSTQRHHDQDMKKSSPETLEELEQRFLQEAVELSKEQTAEEDRESSRHRECLREIQEQYQQKMINLRTKQARQREEFMQHEVHIRQQHYQQQQAGANHYLYESAQYGPSYAFNQHPYEYATHHRKQVNDRPFDSTPYPTYGRNSPAYQRHF